MTRPDGRAPDELRPLRLERGASPYAEGSCVVTMGNTVVLCAASVQDGVPAWRRGSGLGWVTAEYAMLPRSTSERSARERRGPGGRTAEIQRLIGRSLRAALTSFGFGERTITVDCDVLQADGGTRTAAITGGAVALAEAGRWLARETEAADPVGGLVAAVSVGMVDGEVRLDLCYEEDRTAGVDANVVMAAPDRFVEVQATAEAGAFGRGDLDAMVSLAESGLARLFAAQREALRS